MYSWWRHQMEQFNALLALCAGNSPITGEFPSQRTVPRGFDIFLDLRLNKWLSKQSWCWWFGTPSRSLWQHRNDFKVIFYQIHISWYFLHNKHVRKYIQVHVITYAYITSTLLVIQLFRLANVRSKINVMIVISIECLCVNNVWICCQNWFHCRKPVPTVCKLTQIMFEMTQLVSHVVTYTRCIGNER